MSIEITIKNAEIINTGIRPYLSELFEKRNRTTKDAIVEMVKNNPLLVMPKSLVWLATKVKITPDEKHNKSMTTKAGRTLGSKISTHPILNNFREKGCLFIFDRVSFMFKRIKIEPNAKAEEV